MLARSRLLSLFELLLLPVALLLLPKLVEGALLEIALLHHLVGTGGEDRS
jgi:hypothetical protein